MASQMIFHLSWDPKWTQMLRPKRIRSTPQELLPHDAEACYSERSFLPSRVYNEVVINGIHAPKDQKLEVHDDHERYDISDKERKVLVEQLQLRPLANSEKPSKSLDSDIPYRIQVFQSHWAQALNKHISLSESQGRFFLIYLRNWEKENAQSLSRAEKFVISSFKSQNEKLSQNEWKFYWKQIRFLDTSRLKERCKAFSEFVALVNQTAPTVPMHSLSSSPSDSNEVQPFERSMLSSLLQCSFQRSKMVKDEEVKKLFFCIYFENYTELWSDDSIILNGSMRSNIEMFLEKYPKLDDDLVERIRSLFRDDKN